MGDSLNLHQTKQTGALITRSCSVACHIRCIQGCSGSGTRGKSVPTLHVLN